MKRKSNQRITKIKIDRILELVKKAEQTSVKDGTTIQEPGEELVPYPDMNRLRIWSRDYFTKGLDKILINRFDDDGQTYMTTFIDGLPLFTKMTKSFDHADLPLDEYTLSDYLSVNGSLDFSTHWVSGFKSDNYIKFSDFNSTTPFTTGTQFIIKFQTGSDITTSQSILHCDPWLSIQIGDGVFNCYSWSQAKTITGASVSANTTYWIRVTISSSTNRTFEYSTDNFQNVKYIFSTNEINQATTSTPQHGFRIGHGTSTGYDTPFLGKIDLLNSSRRLGSNAVVVPMEIQSSKNTIVETSKPGLWLSNLIAPTAGKGGSWLRHNLIHEDTPIESINNDVIGNYSFSFLQRSEIQREGDETKYIEIAYAQHWSPSVESCTSHDSCQMQLCSRKTLPDLCDYFGKGYAPYQSLVVPVDVDMQSYELTSSKCIDYSFRDGWYEFIMHNFKNHIVGSDWSYTFKFTPNGNGSGNNYGTGDNPEADNGSNGGCITGTITYQNITVEGYTTCQQTINSCFQTGQSIFNPSVPSSDDNNINILDNDDHVLTLTPSALYPYGTPITNGSCSGSTCLYNVRTSDIINVQSTGTFIYGGSTCSFGGWNECTFWSCVPGWPDNVKKVMVEGGQLALQSDGSYKAGNISDNISIYNGNRLLSVTRQSGATPVYGKIHVYVSNNSSDSQNNVNIYLNIIDLKAQYESKGLSWNYDCGTPRFELKFSTTPCEESYCTHLVIASNVDINDLGDISKLNKLDLTM